jgi:glycosyltransferase involved in cell wall biosynthesis
LKSDPTPSVRRLAILGIRGVPARHGGFETFAERLAPWLIEAGWRVTVYCQEDELAPPRETFWEGVRRVHLGVGPDTARNSMVFDWACIRHLLGESPRVPLALTLGYNTAAFGLRLRAAGVYHAINMDGIEWARDKWSLPARVWLYLNDWAGSLGGHHLFADHPEIARHLARRVSLNKISTIPYGTDVVREADPRLLLPLGLQPGGYATLIARAEPENSVLEIVRAFSARRRGVKLVVLGNYQPQKVPYHAEVLAAASDEVMFPGAIYAHDVVHALRRHALLYVHGHRVGGTNPSLLEAMGAGNAVLAHDNRFNRWVAGPGACYFRDVDSATEALDRLLADPVERQRLGRLNLVRATEVFAWPRVLTSYERTLAALHDRATGVDTVSRLPCAGLAGEGTESPSSMDPT